MWIWIAIAVLCLVVFSTLARSIRTRRELRAQYEETLRIWTDTPPDQRLEALRPLLSRANVNAPAWYLTGCWHLAASHPSEAARAFGMAHHADCGLMTAALLTFACLKAQSQPDVSISDQIAATWIELKRFSIPASSQESLLLDTLERARPASGPFSSPLARLTWLTLGDETKQKTHIELDTTT